MAINFVPLDKEKHKDLKVAVSNTFKFAKDTHLAAATIREFAQLAATMPLVFIEDANAKRHHVVAMLGMEQNKNLFLTGDKWQGPDGEKLGVYIDENSDLIGEEGEALFTDAGEPTEFLQNRQQFLADLANSEMMTQRFVQQVVDLDLLDPIQIRLTYQSGQQRNVTGMLSINEKKVLELPEEKVTELHKSGFLGAMYAVMMSAGQLNRLVELSNGTDNPIRSMQLSVVKPEEAQAEAPNA